MPGQLIAVEGGEACGKSTQAALLASALGAWCTREPGGTELGEALRALVLENRGSAPPLDAMAELLVFLAARAEQLAERILPVLERGGDVVVDRFSGSTLAYQGYGRGLGPERVRAACDLAAGGRWPDCNVLLSVPVEVAAARLAGSQHDRIEAAPAEFHRRVAEGFAVEASADPLHWVVVDGDGPVEEVAARVLAGVRRCLPSLGARAR